MLSQSEISNLKPPYVAIYKARFVSDLIGKPEDRFSRDAAHMFCSEPACVILSFAVQEGLNLIWPEIQ